MYMICALRNAQHDFYGIHANTTQPQPGYEESQTNPNGGPFRKVIAPLSLKVSRSWKTSEDGRIAAGWRGMQKNDNWMQGGILE